MIYIQILERDKGTHNESLILKKKSFTTYPDPYPWKTDLEWYDLSRSSQKPTEGKIVGADCEI